MAAEGFAYNPADFEAFAGELRDQSSAADAALPYLDRYLNFNVQGSDTIYGRLLFHHQDVYHAIRNNHLRIRRACHASGARLSLTLDIYNRTAAANRSLVDASIPDAKRSAPPILDSNGGGPPAAGYQECDPLQALKKLAAHPDYTPEEFPDPAKPVRETIDLVTGSGEVEQIITHMVGYDPFERYSTALAGNWKDFWRAGLAIFSLGCFAEGVASNVASGNQALASTWQGDAADQAYNYFVGLASNLNKYSEALKNLSQVYAQLSWDVYNTSRGIADTLHFMFDEVLAAIAVFNTGVPLTLSGVLDKAGEIAKLSPGVAADVVEKASMVLLMIEAGIALGELLAGPADTLHLAMQDMQWNRYYQAPDPYAPPIQLTGPRELPE